MNQNVMHVGFRLLENRNLVPLMALSSLNINLKVFEFKHQRHTATVLAQTENRMCIQHAYILHFFLTKWIKKVTNVYRKIYREQSFLVLALSKMKHIKSIKRV